MRRRNQLYLDRTFEVITYEEWCRRANREPKGLYTQFDAEEEADEALT